MLLSTDADNRHWGPTSLSHDVLAHQEYNVWGKLRPRRERMGAWRVEG